MRELGDYICFLVDELDAAFAWIDVLERLLIYPFFACRFSAVLSTDVDVVDVARYSR